MYMAKAGQPNISASVPMYVRTCPAVPPIPHAPMCSPAPAVSAHVFLPFCAGIEGSELERSLGGALPRGVWALAAALVVTIAAAEPPYIRPPVYCMPSKTGSRMQRVDIRLTWHEFEFCLILFWQLSGSCMNGMFLTMPQAFFTPVAFSKDQSPWSCC